MFKITRVKGGGYHLCYRAKVMAKPVGSDDGHNRNFCGRYGLELAELQDKIDVVECKQEQVEAALEGCGYYLGTNDHVRITERYSTRRRRREQLNHASIS